MSVRSLIAAAAVAGVASLSLFSISAQAESQELRVTVPLEKYNLSKASDAQDLYARLRRASEAACRSLDTRDLGLKRVHEACIDETLDNAVASVGDARLSALHESDSNMRLAARTERPRS